MPLHRTTPPPPPADAVHQRDLGPLPAAVTRGRLAAVVAHGDRTPVA